MLQVNDEIVKVTMQHKFSQICIIFYGIHEKKNHYPAISINYNFLTYGKSQCFQNLMNLVIINSKIKMKRFRINFSIIIKGKNLQNKCTKAVTIKSTFQNSFL